MEFGEQSQRPDLRSQFMAKPASGPVGARRVLPLRALDVQIYLVCERLTEGLIYLMVLFSPWAFGTSQPWAIWVMNSAGYLLGGMLAVRLAIRRLKGYQPPRGDEAEVRSPQSAVLSPLSGVKDRRVKRRGQRS